MVIQASVIQTEQAVPRRNDSHSRSISPDPYVQSVSHMDSLKGLILERLLRRRHRITGQFLIGFHRGDPLLLGWLLISIVPNPWQPYHARSINLVLGAMAFPQLTHSVNNLI